MTPLHTLTLKQALDGIGRKDFTASEIHQSTHRHIAELNPSHNIYLALDHESAQKADALSAAPLAGVPIAVKDNFATRNFPTTASAKVLENFHPAYESTVTARLREKGGVIIGKTNMDAWAHGSSTETSDFGPTRNPRNREHLPGGSSGGSAAAVAADTCISSLGTETAGSIRQPASWCGVVGLKPTYGRFSRFGVVAMGSSLDSPGPLGKTVEDVSMLFDLLAGPDSRDGTMSPHSVPSLTRSLSTGVHGLKIGVAYVDHPNLHGTPAAEAVKNAAKSLEQAGAVVELIPLSSSVEDGKILTPDYAIGVYTVVQRAEVSSNLSRYDGIRYGHGRDLFGAEAKRRIMLGTFTLSKGYSEKYYVKAQQVRSVYIQNFAQLFSRFDAIIAPTSPGYAPKVGASANNPMFGELEDMLVEPSSIAGLPAINVPCGYDPSTNLYLGLDIMAPQWKEETVVRVAATFERVTNFNSWNAAIRKEQA